MKEPAHDGYVYVKVKKGMYRLKRAAVLAYDQLVRKLGEDGYYPILSTAGLWKHHSRRTRIVLCIDDFGIQYHSMEDLSHFLAALKKHYVYTLDISGEHYIGLELKWDYQKRHVDIGMPNYINKLLTRTKLHTHEHILK